MNSDWSAIGKAFYNTTVKLKPKMFPFFQSERMLKIKGDSRAKNTRLLAPSEHQLDIYQTLYPLYDKRFPQLSSIVSCRRPNSTLIDVGANIGDTVALCRLAGCTSKIIAVEPSEKYFGFLQRNAAKNQVLFDRVQCINAFIGEKTDHLVLREGKGTAELIDSALAASDLAGDLPSSGSSTPTLSFSDLNAADVSLVKTDTDGYDAEILSANYDWLVEHRPILWAEAEVKTDRSLESWISLIDRLDCEDYSHVIVFDNYGSAVASGGLLHIKPLICSMLRYIHGHVVSRDEKLGPTTIFYLDLALFSKSDRDVYDDFHSQLVEFA